jgi:uncharacterized protein DUF2784
MGRRGSFGHATHRSSIVCHAPLGSPPAQAWSFIAGGLRREVQQLRGSDQRGFEQKPFANSLERGSLYFYGATLGVATHRTATTASDPRAEPFLHRSTRDPNAVRLGGVGADKPLPNYGERHHDSVPSFEESNTCVRTRGPGYRHVRGIHATWRHRLHGLIEVLALDVLDSWIRQHELVNHHAHGVAETGNALASGAKWRAMSSNSPGRFAVCSYRIRLAHPEDGGKVTSLPIDLPTVFRATADLVVAVHAAFVVFVVLGGLLVARWPRLAWVHVPAAAWGVFIEFRGWICPLTPLENYLRQRGGSSV